MKNILLFLLSILCCCACTTEKKEIVRISDLNYSVLTDSIYTRMPGQLFRVNKYIVWIDPISSENYVHVLDADMGRELKSFGRIGDGPEEFNTISASLTSDSLLLLYDLNKNKQAFVDLEGVVADSCQLYKKWSNEKLGMLTRYLQLDDNVFLSFYPGASLPFTLKGENSTDSIGKFPFSDKIKNGYDIYQGEIMYNADRKCLFYFAFRFPYTAMYELSSGKLNLAWEKKGRVDYQLEDGMMKLDKDVEKGISDVALTKDYIVTVGRDEVVEGTLPKQKATLDMAQLPHSLFVYNYDYELQKIINLDFPVLRVAADIHSNVLYAIIANPEFAIVKFDVP